MKSLNKLNYRHKFTYCTTEQLPEPSPSLTSSDKKQIHLSIPQFAQKNFFFKDGVVLLLSFILPLISLLIYLRIFSCLNLATIDSVISLNPQGVNCCPPRQFAKNDSWTCSFQIYFSQTYLVLPVLRNSSH